MNLRTIYKIHRLSLVILIAFISALTFAQETKKAEPSKPRFYVGLTIGPDMNKIINDGELSVSSLTTKDKNSISGSIDIGYYFSRHLGIVTGLVYSSYNSELTLSTYTNKFNTMDSDTPPESYERRISGSDIHESQKITYLSLPLCLNIEIPFTKKFGMFIQAGANFSFPVSNEYISNGIFTYTGYYPAYNVILQDLPAYGFVSDTTINYMGKLETKSPVISGLGTVGFQYSITEKLQIALGANYCRSLVNISKYESPEAFQLSTDVSQINSMMGGSRSVSTQNIGLRLSFRYYFR